MICDFFVVKLKLYEFAHKKIGLFPESFDLRSALDQISIIAFFGIGLNDSIEKYVVNDGLFWGMFIFSIRRNEFPSFQLELIKDSVNRFQRPKSKQILKQTAYGVVAGCTETIEESLFSIGVFNVNHASSALKKFKSKTSFLLGMADKMVQSSIKEINSIVDSEGNIFVYRGFDFGPKESVRKDRRRLGNEHSHIQETGVGLSFTLDKAVAKEFALSKWSAMQNGEITLEARIFNSCVILEKSGVDFKKFLSDKERFAAIGKYKVNRKHIICNFAYDKNSYKSESEIMVFPENLELIDYRIIQGTKAKS